MTIDEMESNSDIRSKKRKKSDRVSPTKKSELSNQNVPEEMPSAPVSLKKERKSKKLKLSVDSTSESVDEVVSKESEKSLNFVSDEKNILEDASTEAGDSKSTPSQENDSLVNPNRKKKKKNKKSKASSVSESVQSNRDSLSNTTESGKSKKKKKKKKKSKKKNESTNSPPKKENPQSSNAVFRSEKAISYLETWKNDRNKWKFEKLTQLWLCKNMFDEEMVPEATFEILLEYFVDLQGNTKNFVIELCDGIFKKKEEMAAVEEDKILECAYERARSIMQCLK